ncbi:trypsin-like serine protease [Pedobacter caeni]|uniref:Trypsin n=1 Tax=Pedobacter caeni TaxID=288992 RepID=A0A1M5EC13_9SPHI|nr:trypsin-like serine protease [Pedobacter caeni]SHF76778.1 Trypsin [Pedobacter caeni]
MKYKFNAKQFLKLLLVGVVTTIFIYSCKKAGEADEKIQIKQKKEAIIGGDPVSITRVPHQVRINIPNASGGGVVLSKDWIVTAAHVVYGLSASQVNVVSGTTDVTLYPASRQDRTADQIIIHSDYSTSGRLNDIALIHLSTPLTLNESTASIAYATDGNIDITTTTGGYVSGWGVIEDNPYPNPDTRTNVLFGVSVSLSGIEQKLLYTKPYDNRKQQGPCFGDSGGPLATSLRSDGKDHVLIGIVNGWEDCNIGAKGYARISYFAPWILEKTGIPVTYFSKGLSGYFSKNDCPSNFIPQQNKVFYSIGRAEFQSTISQADADAQALNALNSQGQAYANQFTCGVIHNLAGTNTINYGYQEDIRWHAPYFQGDDVKIELYQHNYSGPDVLFGVITEKTPNNGLMVNGINSGNYTNGLQGEYRVKIISLATGSFAFSNYFNNFQD